MRSSAISRLPVVVLLVEPGCDCRCAMCGYWRAGGGARLEVAEVARLVPQLQRLSTELVALSGGEPLLHPAIEELMATVAGGGFAQVLLTNGLRLERLARPVARWCSEVIVSLDGPEAVHDDIRGVPGAYRRLRAGVAALRAQRPGMPISARCTVQHRNLKHLRTTVSAARALSLDGISFLPVDADGSAFRRSGLPPPGLGADDADEVEAAFEDLAAHCHQELASGFIREDREKLRRRVIEPLVAAAERRPGTSPPCNAPWVSAVLEPDGSVRPCFFHRSLGTLGGGTLEEVLNGPEALHFRGTLRIPEDPICRRCVCPLLRSS